MEIDGLVDRDKLLNISGRSRKVQMELAEKWGIKDYPSPAGGCKLTEPNYSVRLKEILDRKDNDVNAKDIALLRFGRHFVTPNGTKIIVSRTAEEGEQIKGLLNKNDILFLVDKFNGAMVIIPEGSNPNEEDITIACQIAVRYSKGKDEQAVTVKYGNVSTKFEAFKEVAAITQEDIKKYNIN